MVNGLATWPPRKTQKKPEKSQGGQGGQPLSFVGPPPVRQMRLAGGQTRPRRANNNSPRPCPASVRGDGLPLQAIGYRCEALKPSAHWDRKNGTMSLTDDSNCSSSSRKWGEIFCPHFAQYSR